MKRTTYIIENRTHIGVGFTGNKGYYFWVPESNRLYQWAGGGWHEIPVSNLGDKRRGALLKVWQPAKSK